MKLVVKRSKKYNYNNDYNMKKLLLISLVALILVGCGNGNKGELVGVRKKMKPFNQQDPYGMVFVPQGSFTMGVSGQDVTSSFLTQAKTITVTSFYMDETEITNNEYREFVYYVRDSLARMLLGEVDPEKFLVSQNKKTGEPYDPPLINWKEKLNWKRINDNQDYRDALQPMYLPENERYYGRKEIDARKLDFHYSWIDLRAAAKKEFKNDADYKKGAFADRPQGRTDRSVYIHNEDINIYPDTLAWIHDYTYAFNDPLTQLYFWHPAYDNYPVVGVNWSQARAFCVWRTNKLNGYIMSNGGTLLGEFRLPTEAEWEWAARGGHHLNPYPWGGPYTRNAQGCYLANFKPLRGDYELDGGPMTIIVGHYPPNDWGLYDMAGNVSEWTSSAFDPVSYNFVWDLNPDNQYNAKPEEAPIMKRKVVKGGSWKDIAHYLEVSTRAYEYQDTAKCYIGFRCIQPFLGRMKGDDPYKASHVIK